MNQNNTPLYSGLLNHKKQGPISLHVPGHKNGSVLNTKADVEFKNLLKIDVTEITGLDDLHSPEGIIAEAENLLKRLYRVKSSYLLVNGSTVGNLAMIMGSLSEGDTVLVQRNSHKSILNGIDLVRARPVFLGPEFNQDWKVTSGVCLKTLKRALELYPETKAVILTYPNYYGMVYDLEQMIRLAHSYRIPVLIDEAHGAHLIASDIFPKSAVELGADVIVQSAHKTLPAMTMGAFIHINSELVEKDRIEGYLRILQSSSPSYPIMASLDLARSYLGTYSKKDVLYLQKIINHFREQLKDIKGIRVLEYISGVGDLLKVTIQSTTELSGMELQKLLEKEGIYSELADPFNVLFVLPLLKKDVEFPLDLIINKINRALKNVPYIEEAKFFETAYPEISQRVFSGEELRSQKTQLIPIKDARDYISAELIVPYPPGIPLIYPGEKISGFQVENLQLILNSKIKIQGGSYLNIDKIKVFK